MDSCAAQLELLIDLEARHEDLLVRLDELDQRVAKTLAECQRYRVVPRAKLDESTPSEHTRVDR